MKKAGKKIRLVEGRGRPRWECLDENGLSYFLKFRTMAVSPSRSANHNKTLAYCGYTSQQAILSLRSYVLPLPTVNLAAKSTIPRLVARLETMLVIVREA